ncbi:fibronectin type III domain-containing protein 7 [Pholidichthys leucotaenia]
MRLQKLELLLLLTVTGVCTAQNDITLSVFTVTSKSMTVQWNDPADASYYKITATPKNFPSQPVFAQFSGNTVMGSVNSLAPNTIYTMQVEAMDNDLNVIRSAETEEITAPDVPSIEHVYSKTSESITVEFTEVWGATSYVLRAESPSGDFFYETRVMTSPGTVMHLEPYTEYVLSVMSVNAGGRSQPSYPAKARTVVTTLQMITSSPSNGSIHVTWPPVEHGVLYTLCIIQEGSSDRVKLNTSDTAVTFDDLEPGTKYFIKGNAWDSEGRAGDDATVSQITRPGSPFVFRVEVIPGRGPRISVDWMAVKGAISYHAQTSNNLSCTTGVPHCDFSPAECGQTHTVTVQAYNAAGPSSPSPPAKFITYPCPPENVWVEEPTPGNCSVVWDDVPLKDRYMVFIKRDDGHENQCNTTKPTCHFFCMCGYTYLTSVYPYNQAGASLLTQVYNYTTVPCCPKDVTIKLASTDTLEIEWSPVRGADLFETTAAETNNTIHCNDTAPMCALSDLRCNTQYSVMVTPCSELRGCNRTCTQHTHSTAPCTPEIHNMTQVSNSTYRVHIITPNSHNTNYTITATRRATGATSRATRSNDKRMCHSNPCELTQLDCGSTYDVTAVASSPVGKSLPGFSKTLETGPCCPTSVNVTQVTQAMTNVTWSSGTGARSYIASLTSPRGSAKCHTQDTDCLMGCITCGTSYSVLLEAISSTGHKTECKYHGFSSSACCPTGVRLYRKDINSLRVYWHSLGPQKYNHTVELYGTGANYTCMAAAGSMFCDIQEGQCGDVYTVMAAPVGQNGVKVHFCKSRNYSVPCPGSQAGMIISRGRRSVS